MYIKSILISRLLAWKHFLTVQIIFEVTDTIVASSLFSTSYLSQDKAQLSDEMIPGLVEIVGEEEVAQRILRAAKSSMGMDTSEQDMLNIIVFTERFDSSLFV